MAEKRICANCKEEINETNKGCWIDYQGDKVWFCSHWACQQEAEEWMDEDEDYHFRQSFNSRRL